MTERIKELAQQAADGMLSYDAEGEWRLNQKEAEKFALLIVRECAKIGEDYGDDGLSSDPEGNRYPLNAGIAIRKHLGVEE